LNPRPSDYKNRRIDVYWFAGEKASRDLNARFPDWFYVTGAADFQ